MLYDTVQQMTKMLGNLKQFLEAGDAYATEKEFPVERLLEARLAPDMFQLTRQIQSACDSAKFAAARLTATEPPSFPDEEKTLDEFYARIDDTIEFIESIDAPAYEGIEGRMIKLPFLPEQTLATTYFQQFAVPNFYFHVTTAYAILRHNGVPLGKRMFIGNMT